MEVDSQYFDFLHAVPKGSLSINKNLLTKNFGVGPLRRLGIEGWEIVAVIPKTLGFGLKNWPLGHGIIQGVEPPRGLLLNWEAGSWGAGLGGNVVGVYLVIKKELSAQQNISTEFLVEYFKRNMDDFFTEDEIQILKTLLK